MRASGHHRHKRSGHASWLIWGILLAEHVAPKTAYGEPTAQPTIVLKGRIGLPGPNAPKWVEDIAELIDDQFEAVGFASRPATVARILGGRLPRPGVLDRGLSAADLIRPIELGYSDWSKGLFADAVKKLLPAQQMLFRNPGLLVTDTKNQDSTFKGLVALSLSQMRIDRPDDAAKTMTDAVRIFRTRPVSRGDWGRSAEEYWRSIARPVLAGGTGQLYVTTGNDHAVIYVDNQIRGIGKAEVGDMVPGPHHVLLQVPATAGLQYVAELKANENTYLDIRWDAENALAIDEHWIGFVVSSEAERAREASFAEELTQCFGGQSMLVVVDVVGLQGDPVLIGTLYRAGGKMIRKAAANLSEDPVTQVHDLAQFLQNGSVGSRLKVIRHDANESASSFAMDPPSSRSTLVAKAVGGAGALAIAVGGVVYVTSKADDYTQPTYDDKRSPAVQVVVGGSVVLGGGVYLWLRESRSAGILPSLALGAGTASMIAGGVLILTDEDLHTQGYQRRYYRDTATTGVIVGAAGLAATGVGVWLLYRERNEPKAPNLSEPSGVRPAPIVAVDRSHALVGWAGRF